MLGDSRGSPSATHQRCAAYFFVSDLGKLAKPSYPMVLENSRNQESERSSAISGVQHIQAFCHLFRFAPPRPWWGRSSYMLPAFALPA